VFAQDGGLMDIKKRKVEAMKSEILHAAAQLFFKKGYADVTVENIAKEVGLTSGALYYYFKNKEDIFTSLDKEVVDRFLSIISKFDHSEKELEILLVDFLKTLVSFAMEKREYFLFLVEAFSSVNAETLMNFKNRRLIAYKQLMKKLRELFNRAIERKEIKSINPEDLSLFITGLVHGVFINWMISGVDKTYPEQKGRVMLDILFNGIRKREA
jgi:AcrR family transcriptional regulator